MPNFDIVKTNKPKLTFRVSKIQSDFDVKFEHSNERFTGNIELPENWQIGVIVGASGTGKTTIAKEIFSDCYVKQFEYKSDSVVDDMPDLLWTEMLHKRCALQQEKRSIERTNNSWR